MVRFDPEKVGKFEVSSWKAHNEKNHKLLLTFLIQEHLELFGLSEGEARESLEPLIEATKYHDIREWGRATNSASEYYRKIKDATGMNFDNTKAAKLEVGWWKLHDELEKNLTNLNWQMRL
ncbi:hypothetical protein A3A76_05330 [Candidatus Woesebacteria bacterium RIFCSPLOWO2_01_FULL_39_23]|uniref:Uncharacterized protein n=2 Tax=Microgenomates group TaxID=1794810 RepID=A0A0H4T3S5_9BACT|nr:hypothetical protein [uncultured Microgenomates bacterium Rifle_16ft_4_minimus_37633]OGM13902.1 MAG: hypothetical protein A2141_04555 [Candidatus Woesebacteria bacterium RBG_16_40_11]OGM27854.1 MAG: hypothetical protein A2628_05550 [Candidatus Woesebacteria bacterium RIFCSPHIGHO2_01_FULL_40_22]OGM36316.1 MAG: hypothetical protein A3E41_02745 [Candidatus Woesebacteria bacterium RIFCSPHIGHO2_12_FULL_38_9]OGM62276.1 MAG: hypothetical protein A3A76_05330 [Candidatus Woesebacteria bacterium RIFCS